MKRAHIPKYSEGEIAFRLKYSDKEFAKAFSEKLGYEFLGENFLGEYIVKTGKGKEEEAIKVFSSYNQLVDVAYKRDTEYEIVSEFFNKIKNKIESLEEMYDNSTKNKFKKNLEKIIGELKEFKNSF